MLKINSDNYELMFDLLRQIGYHRNWKENFVFSPIGISVELGIIAQGAYGPSKNEIIHTIGNEFMDNFTRRKYIDKKCMKLFTIIFHSLSMRSTYASKIGDKYGTFFCPTNFKKKQEALKKINYWISDVTNDSITWVIDSKSFDTDTSFVISGTSMMKASWSHDFKSTKSVFILSNGKTIAIKAIATKKIFKYSGASIANISICEIPFNNPRYSSFVIMPRYHKDLHKIVQTLNTSTYQYWIHCLTPLKVRVTIPKFSIYTSESIGDYLFNIGITKVFSIDADFPFIFTTSTKLDHITSSTYILVDEDGIISSEQLPKPTPKYNTTFYDPEFEFNVNKPFLFIVHDRFTNCVIYCCTIVDPTMSTLK